MLWMYKKSAYYLGKDEALLQETYDRFPNCQK